MKLPMTLALALTAAVVTTPALADRGPDDVAGYRDVARVVDVTPIFRRVQVSTPHRVCRDEEVTRYRDRGYRSATPVILGSIIGGVIGHQISSHHSKGIGTVAGAVLGGSIGADAEHNAERRDAVPETATVERCRIVQDVHVEQQRVGYRVRYRYHGRDFETRFDAPPGPRIPVRVSVVPAD